MVKESHLNFNTILLAITLSAIGWVGYQTTEGIKALSSLQANVANISKQTEKLELKFSETVSRREYDSRLTSIEASILEMRIELNKLKSKTGG